MTFIEIIYFEFEVISANKPIDELHEELVDIIKETIKSVKNCVKNCVKNSGETSISELWTNCESITTTLVLLTLI
jgi:hypothetical protein